MRECEPCERCAPIFKAMEDHYQTQLQSLQQQLSAAAAAVTPIGSGSLLDAAWSPEDLFDAPAPECESHANERTTPKDDVTLESLIQVHEHTPEGGGQAEDDSVDVAAECFAALHLHNGDVHLIAGEVTVKASSVHQPRFHETRVCMETSDDYTENRADLIRTNAVNQTATSRLTKKER
jgi:hypothetical protein